MPEKSIETIEKELKEPFPEADIEWRIQQSGYKKGPGDPPWALVLAYVNNRAIQERLDSVVGAFGWRVTHREINGGFVCRIEIKIDGEWIGKEDGAPLTDIEPIKGGISNAQKRAASQWGIGRYLYDLETNWAEFDEENGTHRDKIRDKNSGKEGWHRWNPPPLPDWALPGGKRTADPAKKEKPKEKPKDKVDDFSLCSEKQRTAIIMKWKHLCERAGLETKSKDGEILAGKILKELAGVKSSKDLTGSQASQWIDDLEGPRQDEFVEIIKQKMEEGSGKLF